MVQASLIEQELAAAEAAASFPLPVRQAVERLSTTVTQRQAAPFTINPISDMRLIIAHLSIGTQRQRHDGDDPVSR